MIERTGIALALIVAGIALYRLFLRSRLARSASATVGLEGYSPGRLAVLYFSGEGCAPCHTIQRPALDELSSEYAGMLQVIEVDALARPDLADAWGVLSLPTTFLIDRHGRPRRVNHGPTRADRLRAQMAEIGEAPAGRAASPAPARSGRGLD
jgi:thiol-disulfide isomerase/thioredoxin